MTPANELLKLFVVMPEFGDSIPRIRDLTLARRLEAPSQKSFVELLERMESKGDLDGAYRCTKKGKTQRWLTEKNVCHISIEVETRKGRALMHEMISVVAAIPTNDLSAMLGEDNPLVQLMRMFDKTEHAQ